MVWDLPPNQTNLPQINRNDIKMNVDSKQMPFGVVQTEAETTSFAVKFE